MPLAGFLTAQGQLSLVGVVLAGMLGSVLGALPLYGVGTLVSEARVTAWAERYKPRHNFVYPSGEFSRLAGMV
jgi:membrane protein DedA with SNARE-associated domain